MLIKLTNILSWGALAALLTALYITRNELGGVALLAPFLILSWLGGIVACILAFVAFFRTPEKRRAAITDEVIALFCVLAPLYGLMQGQGAPPIHDISTDLKNPPIFRAAPMGRPDFANPLSRETPDLAQIQARAYPDIKTLRFSEKPAPIFAALKSLLQQEGVSLTDMHESDGHLEGVATTFIMGFKDDIVFRLRPSRGGTALDMRSVSRIGVSDLGANASRIRKIREALQSRFSAAP